MRWLNADVKRDYLTSKSEDNLRMAERCLQFAEEAFTSKNKEEYDYWLKLADIYCKLVIARNTNDR